MKKIKMAGLLFFCMTLLSMDEKEKKEIIPLTRKDLVFYLVSANYLDAHESVCSFAATNKTNNKLMLDTAQKRKNLLRGVVSNDHMGIIWHKYGTACCSAYKVPDLFNLCMAHHTLKINQEITTKIVKFEHFQYQLPSLCKSIPFVNEKGELSFYGYGSILSKENTCSCPPILVGGIIRYDLNKKMIRCVLGIKHIGVLVSRLDMFLEFPYLLKAILDSSVRKQKKCLKFMLEGVTLPDNYKELKCCDSSHQMTYTNFEEIAEHIRNPIEKHYESQKNKNGIFMKKEI